MNVLKYGSVVFGLSAASYAGYSFTKSRHFFQNSSRQPSKGWDHAWDSSLPYEMPDNQVQRCYKLIILVRHGQYKTKASSREQKVLTKLGWQQAMAAGKRLRDLGYNIDCIVHSDLVRARQTAAGLISELGGVELSDTGILRIVDNPGLFPSETEKDQHSSPLKSVLYPLLESSLLGEGPPPVEPEPSSDSKKNSIAMLNGKEYAERVRTQNRIGASFGYHVHRRPISEAGQQALMGPSKCCGSPTCACSRATRNEPLETIVFVGHANVFRYWLCKALQLPPEAWLRVSLPHGSLTELLIEQQTTADGTTGCTVQALRIGDDGHLPAQLRSR